MSGFQKSMLLLGILVVMLLVLLIAVVAVQPSITANNLAINQSDMTNTWYADARLTANHILQVSGEPTLPAR